MSRIRHAELKAGRALEHLDALKTEFEAYYNSSPITVTRDTSSDGTRRILRVHFSSPDERLHLIAGDFVHNLRSALDHIVYALVVESSGQLPTSRSIQWPVLEAPNESCLKRQINGASEGASILIESLQPYNSPCPLKQNHLWRLSKLDIIDKHRRITFNEHAVNASFPGLTPSSDFTKDATDDGFKVSFPFNGPPVEMQYDPRPEVLFGDSTEGLSVCYKDLEAMYVFVATQVIPRFIPFLP